MCTKQKQEQRFRVLGPVRTLAGSSVRTTRMRCDAYVNTVASEKDTYEKKLV